VPTLFRELVAEQYEPGLIELRVSMLMTMATNTKRNQVIRFIVSKSTAVFEMMNLKITHGTAYLAAPTVPL
jgi:hypothetical protein